MNPNTSNNESLIEEDVFERFSNTNLRFVTEKVQYAAEYKKTEERENISDE